MVSHLVKSAGSRRAADPIITLLDTLLFMADGEQTATSGNFGRLAPPPEGMIYIRDPEAARADAIRRKADVFTNASQAVPDDLKKQIAALTVPEGTPVLKLVDAITGEPVDTTVKLEGSLASWQGETPPAPAAVTPPAKASDLRPSGDDKSVPNKAQDKADAGAEPEPKPEATAEDKPKAVAEAGAEDKPEAKPRSSSRRRTNS